MKKIIEYLGYNSDLEYNNRILYLMYLCCILVAAFFLTIYLLYIPLLPAIIAHFIYITFCLGMYGFLKKRKFVFAKVSLILSHLIQLTLAVYLWFPMATGYNIYYFMVPMVSFIIMDYGSKKQRIFAISASVLSGVLYFISEIIVDNYYLYETSPELNRFLGSISILFIFIPMTYIFTLFASDRYYNQKELKLHANTDFLTKTYNRRILYEFGEEAIGKANVSNQDFSLIVFDIDYFKKVNDRYGHPVGDELLKQLSILVTSKIRKDDIFSRYGGEEFAILLKNTNSVQGRKIANELLEIIENEIFKVDEIEIQITISIGLIQYVKNIKEFNEMMKLADKALYSAKENGRNQVAFI